jgi:hypothetical protein
VYFLVISAVSLGKTWGEEAAKVVHRSCAQKPRSYPQDLKDSEERKAPRNAKYSYNRQLSTALLLLLKLGMKSNEKTSLKKNILSLDVAVDRILRWRSDLIEANGQED